MRIAFATPAPSTHGVLEVSNDQPRAEVAKDKTVGEGVDVNTPPPNLDALSQQETRAWTHLSTKKSPKVDIVEVEEIPLEELDDEQS